MTDSAIKSALRIISGNNGFWLYADKVNRITPIRTISLYKGYFFYFFAPTYSIPSHSYTRYNRYNRCELGTFVSKSFEIIPSSEHSNNLNSLDYSTQYFRSSNILKEIFSKKLNISEDYFLIILTWLIQSIIYDNYTLLELVGE